LWAKEQHLISSEECKKELQSGTWASIDKMDAEWEEEMAYIAAGFRREKEDPAGVLSSWLEMTSEIVEDDAPETEPTHPILLNEINNGNSTDDSDDYSDEEKPAATSCQAP
jgi:hypothetical protein